MGVGPIKSTRVTLPKQIIVEPPPVSAAPPKGPKKKKCPIRRRSLSVAEQRRRSAELSDGYPCFVIKESLGDLKSLRASVASNEDGSIWASSALLGVEEFQNVTKREALFPKIAII